MSTRSGLGDVVEAMRAQRLVPVIRADDAAAARARASRCAAAGLRVLELTTTIPEWPELLRAVQSELDDPILGVGTVTTAEQARAALDGGAAFLVTPRLAPAVREAGRSGGVPVIEAGFTPTELAEAGAGGIAKLFPAHVGGPAYLRSIRAVMPGMEIVPTGGIVIEDVPEWLQAGALAVGVGSDLTAAGDIDGRLRAVREGPTRRR